MDQPAPAVISSMTPADVAEVFQVTVPTVWGWIREGILPAVRTPGGRGWRIRPEDVQALLTPSKRE